MSRENDDRASAEQRLNEVIATYLRALDAGQSPDRSDLLAHHPDLADELRSFLANHDRAQRLATPPAEAPTLAPAEMASPSPTLGTVRYFGDYELLAEIARGGMGVVYRARQVSLNRPVALKMILSGQLASEDDVQRFRLEAQTAAGLQHPNIVAIHEVGEHEGQHYFSMDFVEGQSLAELVRENPLPPEQAARWVRTIAEAIHYAHQRGVLHRDLKPSNVLIDSFGQPRVTDFGLAKRTDKDTGLTATGAVVGTPSYMPPEQASADRGAIGPASDVYSLGAVLYELVTGRPPFRAATPLDTLLQVLEAEPAPPRLLNPAVGRDLETIILKCLQKEAARRYASAQELADDLSALLEGRPIKARRPGLAERALRWAQTQRRAAALIVLSAVGSALLLFGGTLGWNWYSESRLARLLIQSGGPPYRVELLDDEGREVIKPFQTVTPGPVEGERVALPAGDFDLCLSAPFARGETYRLRVEPGGRPSFFLAPESRQPWEPLRIKAGEFVEVFDTGGRADFVLVTQTGLTRLSGATREPLKGWGDQPLAESPVARSRGFDWNQVLLRSRPWLVQPAPIVEDDRLLIWASRSSPSLVAFSGKTGRLRWWHRAWPSLPAGLKEEQIDRYGPPGRHTDPFNQGQVIVEPIVAESEGAPVVVATFAAPPEDFWIKEGAGRPGRTTPEVWVEAINARTGGLLWRCSLGEYSGHSTVHGNYATSLLSIDGRSVLAVMTHRRLLGLDLRSGKVEWSHDLEPIVERSADYGMRSRPSFGTFGAPSEPAAVVASKNLPSDQEMVLSVISLKAGRLLWQQRVPWPLSGSLRDMGGPLVADLDGNGRTDVILAYPEPSQYQDRGAVAVFDGATGQRRWLYQFPTAQQFLLPGLRPFQVTVGPDLDGDGQREVFLASVFAARPGEDRRVFVEALSGSEGRPLWRWSHALWGGEGLGALSWWDQPDAHGQPHLLVPVVDMAGQRTDHTFVLSASSGRLSQIVAASAELRQADLDGDGIPDLWSFNSDAPVIPGAGLSSGVLTALRGTPPDMWRRVGQWQPAGDLDGDGIPDAIHPWGIEAVSGKDGHMLWPTDTLFVQSVLPLPMPYGDLDGDGIADLLLFRPIEGLSAVSGKTGKSISGWKSDFTGRLSTQMNLLLLECRELDGDGTPVLLFAFSRSLPDETFKTQITLGVLSLKDGKTRWRTTLNSPTNNPDLFSGFRLRPGLADLNGDGVLDVMTWAVSDDNLFEVRAVSGRDGALLWSRSLRPVMGLRPVVAVDSLGGEPVVVVDCGDGEVRALDRLGNPLWTWKGTLNSGMHPRPTPVFVDLPGGGRGVCVSGLPNDDQAVLLNAAGHLLQTVSGLRRLAPNRPDRRIPQDFSMFFRSLDARGSALLSIAEGKLRRTNGGLDRANLRWEWPLPDGAGDVLDVLGEGDQATVVVRSGNAVHGLNGGTGRVRWRCDGPCPATDLLPASDPAAPPLVLFAQTNGATTCRRALEVGPDGRYQLPAAEPISFAPLPEDPRVRVPLPWRWELSRLPSLDWPAFLLIQFALVLSFVLGRSAAWVFRRGAWFIGILLVVLLVVVLAGAVALVRLREEPHFSDQLGPWLIPVGHALLGLPILVFLGQMVVWGVQGRWRRVSVLLAASVLLSVPLGAFWMWQHASSLGPTQHYDRDGWYSGWVMGAYATGALLVLGWLLRGAYRGLRRIGRWTLRLVRPAVAG
jgi:outer membrane protein assembly factor BamB